MRRTAFTLTLPLALAACQPGGDANIPGSRDDHQPYAEIGEGETLKFTGTEPFWGGEVIGETLTWKSPEQPDGQSITVSRFAGRGGLSYSGVLDGASFAMAVTPGTCSDGMSDRSYPFVVTLQLGEEARDGCAWSDVHPFTESKAG
ncbi:MAG: COG3650 family protein [Sphingobium sp.]